MPIEKNWRQRAEISSVASRLLTIPVMALALLVAYLSLRSETAESPALMADISAEWVTTPDQTGPPASARPQRTSWPEPAAADAAIAAHETLDPSGAGRSSP